MFNQIHAPAQVVARGKTSCDDAELRIQTDGTHALSSEFRWNVTGA